MEHLLTRQEAVCLRELVERVSLFAERLQEVDTVDVSAHYLQLWVFLYLPGGLADAHLFDVQCNSTQGSHTEEAHYVRAAGELKDTVSDVTS